MAILSTLSREVTGNGTVVVAELVSGNCASVSIAMDYTDILQQIADSVLVIEQNTTEIKNTLDSIDTTLKSIDASWNNIESYVGNLNTRGSTHGMGILTHSALHPFSTEQQRAMLISALKNAGTLNSVISEINNPTSLPKDNID